MAEFSRVRNGVVRPVERIDPASNDHHLTIAEATEFRQHPVIASPNGGGCALNCNAERTVLLLVRSLGSSSADVRVLELESCDHRTILIRGGAVGRLDHQLAILTEPESGVLKRIVSECSRQHDYSQVTAKFQDWTASDLAITVDEAIREPYAKALDWNSNPKSPALISLLRPLIAARATLAELFVVAKSRAVEPRQIQILETAAQRVDTALLSLSAWQTVLLEETAHNLEIAAARNEKQERAHDRRIADLGAITLFPLLLFGLLGANILPDVEYGFKVNGIAAFIVSMFLAVSIAYAGRAWIRRRHRLESAEDRHTTNGETVAG